MKIVRVQIRVSQNTPPNENGQSPNPSVPEYPPKMKIVRESKSECPRIPPNENCQRVQIRVSQNTPPNENCQSPNPSVSEYPPKSEKLQISNFRIVLQSGRWYVETNL